MVLSAPTKVKLNKYPTINTCQVSPVRKASSRTQEVPGSILTGSNFSEFIILFTT